MIETETPVERADREVALRQLIKIELEIAETVKRLRELEDLKAHNIDLMEQARKLRKQVLDGAPPPKQRKTIYVSPLPRGETTNRVLEALSTGPATIGEIANATDLGLAQVKMTLIRANAAGKVEKDYDQKWSLIK